MAEKPASPSKAPFPIGAKVRAFRTVDGGTTAGGFFLQAYVEESWLKRQGIDAMWCAAGVLLSGGTRDKPIKGVILVPAAQLGPVELDVEE